MENKVYDVVEGLIQKLKTTQEENVEKTARLFADALKNGGMLQAFGSGHSQAGASELCFRAVGTSFMKKVDVRPNDVVVLISNSGRNPLPVEIALAAHEKGAKVVAITSLEASKNLTPKHSCGKNLWQLADVVIDNCVMDGDASIDVEGLDTRICGMSAITTAILIQACVYRTAQMLLEEGIVPPVFKSQNIDGGPEYNDRLLAQYFDRMYHM